MEELKLAIKEKGKAIGEEIIKVDSFLNHQVDVDLMNKIGKTFADKYKDCGITKVATIESSGIAPATMTALYLNVPMIILKKNTSKILSEDFIKTQAHSFTKDLDYELIVSKKFINENDKILFIDDFLANGEAVLGAKSLIEMQKAKIAGVGIVIEKSFQSGRKKLENVGINPYSLARISGIVDGVIEFVE